MDEEGEVGEGIGAVLQSLDSMEQKVMELGDTKEAERRLRERARRANANEIAHRLDEGLQGQCKILCHVSAVLLKPRVAVDG